MFYRTFNQKHERAAQGISRLMSFYNGQLCVKVQGREINATTLKSHMERIHNERPGAIKGTYGNYLAV